MRNLAFRYGDSTLPRTLNPRHRAVHGRVLRARVRAVPLAGRDIVWSSLERFPLSIDTVVRCSPGTHDEIGESDERGRAFPFVEAFDEC